MVDVSPLRVTLNTPSKHLVIGSLQFPQIRPENQQPPSYPKPPHPLKSARGKVAHAARSSSESRTIITQLSKYVHLYNYVNYPCRYIFSCGIRRKVFMRGENNHVFKENVNFPQMK